MTRNQSLTTHLPTAKRPWLWLVLVGFLWLQFAGVVHKHSHTDLYQTDSQLEQILPEHSPQNKSDCQLLDLQCTGLALSQALPVLALPVFALQTAWLEVAAFFTSPSLVYQARAPPKPLI